jgi:hypothetical protein
MGCDCQTSNKGTDKLELQDGQRLANTTADAWLIKQAVMYLNSGDQLADRSYRQVIELLLKQEAANTVVQLVRVTPKTDVTLKWSLLYILGDLQQESSAKWLASYVVEPLPERGQGCEGPRDGELLLRTMAVQSLLKIALRNPAVSEMMLKIISGRPDRAVLIEAIKAAIELGLRDKITDLLPEEDRWMINIRKARIEEFRADPGRTDTKEIGYKPPKRIVDYTTPSIKCACTKGGINHG